MKPGPGGRVGKAGPKGGEWPAREITAEIGKSAAGPGRVFQGRSVVLVPPGVTGPAGTGTPCRAVTGGVEGVTGGGEGAERRRARRV